LVAVVVAERRLVLANQEDQEAADLEMLLDLVLLDKAMRAAQVAATIMVVAGVAQALKAEIT
jgi:hypothetical protein